MIKIGEQSFTRKSDMEDNLAMIRQYAKDEQVIVTNEEGEALDEEQIRDWLNEHDMAIFQVKQVQELERETIASLIEYIDHAQIRIGELVEETNAGIIYQAFVEMIESLQYIESVTQYFGITNVSAERIKILSERALQQIELDNSSYIIDLFEFECLPLLLRIRESLEQWKIN
ncbi:MAG: hypothetical protein J7559_03025 [Cohnella sp.]|nr:hypothetical protein [Cohnella sp.]